MVVLAALATANPQALNESPSEKEGKSDRTPPRSWS